MDLGAMTGSADLGSWQC